MKSAKLSAGLPALPVEMQEQAANILMAFVGDDQPLLALTPEEVVDLTAAQ